MIATREFHRNENFKFNDSVELSFVNSNKTIFLLVYGNERYKKKSNKKLI